MKELNLKRKFKKIVWVGFLNYPERVYDVYWTKAKAEALGCVEIRRCILKEI